MPAPKPRRLDQVLNAPAGRLGAMTAHARRLAEAARQLEGCLPAEVAAHCRLADLSSGRLVLAADTPAWATRLRYHTADIRQTLGAADCRVIVAPAPAEPATVRPPAPAMSDRAADSLESTADAVGDAALAAALRRLAANRTRQA